MVAFVVFASLIVENPLWHTKKENIIFRIIVFCSLSKQKFVGSTHFLWARLNRKSPLLEEKQKTKVARGSREI